MYWRRIALADIPLDDTKAFETWMLSQWQIKEDLLEGFEQNGRFPADDGIDAKASPAAVRKQGAGFIETLVRLNHWYDVLRIFAAAAAFAFVANVLAKVYNLARYGDIAGLG